MADKLSNISREDLEAEVRRLRQRETFFNATQEVARFGYCEWDYDQGKIVSCTTSYARIFGMSIEEVIDNQSSREKFFAQVHPADHGLFKQASQSRIETGQHDVEYRIYHKDGGIRFIKEVTVLDPNKDDSGSPALILIQDITEHAKMRKEIGEGSAKLKLAAKTAKLGYCHYDEIANKYIDISEEYAEGHGYEIDEFLSQYLSLDKDMEQVYPDDLEGLVEAYDLAEGRVNFNFRLRHKKGHWINGYHQRSLAGNKFTGVMPGEGYRQV
jgi:PAS domain S-box-containing protein